MATHDATPLHRLLSHHGTRRFLMALRVPLGLALAIIIATNADDRWLWPGLFISALGTLGQLWCLACVHKRKTLAIHGPYAVVRNPMYLARYVVAAGALLILGKLWLVAGFTVVYLVYMVTRVSREEPRLRKAFGAPYDDYCETVPRFFPRVRPLEGSRLLYANLHWFRRNHGPLNAVCMGGAYALILILAR